MAKVMNEDQFRESIYNKYPRDFDHFYSLFSLAEEAVGSYRSWTTNAYQACLSLIFARAYKSFDSIRRLSEVASCEDAAVILRSLLNLLAVTRWISLDPDKRARRYVDWYWVQMKADAERFKSRIPAAAISTIQGRYDAVKSEFQYKDKQNRSRFAQHWYQPDAHSIRDLFEQVDLGKQYEEGYKPLSATEHSDSSAFFGMVAQMDHSGGERRIEIHSDMFLPHYLRNAFQYFADIFCICNKAISLADPERLEAVVSAGIDFYRADMIARGMAP